MNTQSFKCTRKQLLEECKQLGDFCFTEGNTHLLIVRPTIEARIEVSAIAISLKPGQGPRVWHWNGDEEKPSLTPSLHWPGQWHGFLTNGEMKSC